MHKFKRFYLLFAVALSFGIPLVTFTEYVVVTPMLLEPVLETFTIDNTAIINEPTNYVSVILWSIYGIGILVFSIKFIKNSTSLFLKIKQNPKQKLQNHTNVLLAQKTTPHTFLSYIFLNKKAYEHKEIPAEVLLHEITHVKQKHSVDILFIELLQIAFWCNPLVYFAKHAIKLNHEFLADQAVLNNGVDATFYSKILLAFSSNSTEPVLANSINYSSIKKRFTVMKKNTSKTSIWLRSTLALPLVALLLYSFSTTQIKEISIDSENEDIQHPIKEKLKSEAIDLDKIIIAEVITIQFNKEQKVIVNNQVCEITDLPKKLSSFNKHLSQKQKENMVEINISTINNTPESYLDQVIQYAISSGATTVNLIKNGLTKEEIKFANTETTMQIKEELKKIEHLEFRYIQEKATPEMVTEYNVLAKKYNEQHTNKRIIKQKEVDRLKYIFNLMTTKQKKNAQPFPKLPPPPPAPPIVKKGEVSNIPPPPPPTIHSSSSSPKLAKAKAEFLEATKKYGKAVSAYTKHKTGSYKELNKKYDAVMDLYATYDKLAKKENKAMDVPPPPPPVPPMVKKGEKSDIPPPPAKRSKVNVPDTSSGFIEINNTTHFYATNKKGKTKYYDRWGMQVTKEGQKISNKQTKSTDVIKGQNIAKVYKDNKVVSEFSVSKK